MIHFRRKSLRHSAAATVGFTLLTAAAFATLIATVMYRVAFERIAEEKSLAVTRNYEDKLRNIAQGWEEQLMREKTRLEFSRLLVDPEGRWDRLSAYLASLSNSTMYAGITICDQSGKTLFQEGPRIPCHGSGSMLDATSGHAHDYLADKAGNLFVELDSTIWLGPDGMGVMHLAIPLDHALLWSNASRIPSSSSNGTAASLPGRPVKLHRARDRRVLCPTTLRAPKRSPR